MLPYIFAGLVIAANHVKFQPEAQEEFESEASLAAAGEEESEPQVVSGPLVSWADMRHVSYFLILCMLWWRFMIRGFVPNL